MATWPKDYAQLPRSGHWVRKNDSSGPFYVTPGGVPTPYVAESPAPPASATPSLIFLEPINSMYLALVSVGGM